MYSLFLFVGDFDFLNNVVEIGWCLSDSPIICAIDDSMIMTQ